MRRDWLDQLARFTVESLQQYAVVENSVYYLLSLWARLVGSIPYLRGSQPVRIDQYAPAIMQTWIQTRLDAVAANLRQGDGALCDLCAAVCGVVCLFVCLTASHLRCNRVAGR